MTKALFFVLAAALIVAALGFEEEEEDFDVAQMKRDPQMHEFLWAEKRGKNMKKYKACIAYGQECTCQRRTGAVIYCAGAGNGDSM